MTYTVKVTGFVSAEAAQTFVKWYEGQGEQDAAIWFDEWCPDQEVETDIRKTFQSGEPIKDREGNFVIHLKENAK